MNFLAQKKKILPRKISSTVDFAKLIKNNSYFECQNWLSRSLADSNFCHFDTRTAPDESKIQICTAEQSFEESSSLASVSLSSYNPSDQRVLNWTEDSQPVAAIPFKWVFYQLRDWHNCRTGRKRIISCLILYLIDLPDNNSFFGVTVARWPCFRNDASDKFDSPRQYPVTYSYDRNRSNSFTVARRRRKLRGANNTNFSRRRCFLYCTIQI